ncbi:MULTISPECIES: DUF2946 family protein [Sphingobium]|uniref:DUF2946 domain-containing protein n=1 Tax=Sphingobium indicum (strain DSM 16413 / CCM 7287 / MTCC 6362 / UT26 / NBRC 101211 / UT26S) TaxID=452662 RepID=D4Z295_SPHIU|nr:hypothetical protein SJA_C1-18930 [Sphingobium indicum UT26S]
MAGKSLIFRSAYGSVRKRGSARREATLAGRGLAVLLATLLAFTWHSLVVQTHVHRVSVTVTHGGEAKRVSPHEHSHDNPEDAPTNCPLCDEIGLSGDYLLPPVPSLPEPAVAVAWVWASIFLFSFKSDRSHSWRSRAPPSRQMPSTT